MFWMYLIAFIFSAHTLFFMHDAHKQKHISKKAFITVGILETLVMISTSVLLILSL